MPKDGKVIAEGRPVVLVVDDDNAVLDSLSSFLTQEKWHPVCSNTANEAIEKIRTTDIRLVISDINMPDMDGLTLLEAIRKTDPDVEVVMMTGFSSEETAIEALRLGAFDYFRKPINGSEILASLNRAKRMLELKSKNVLLSSLVSRLTYEGKGDFIGESPAFNKIYEQMKKIAMYPDATVLLTGESGTGKEVVAQMLHKMSKDKEKQFVAFNCGGVAENLLERELFGHEKGAFTGAEKRSPGLFEIALGGTVLLDEISEMSMTAQTRFLRVLEERTFKRVGGTSEISLGDTRIIGATNRDLGKFVAEGNFRQDLFYRLNVLLIEIPPLRERKEDILLLARHILRTLFQGRNISLTPSAEKVLLSYDYPGNVRELRNILQNAAILSAGEKIDYSDLRLLKKNDSISNGGNGSSSRLPESLKIEENEKLLIIRAIEESGNNLSSASRALGITTQSLYRRMEKYGITVD
ncbi:MAG: sigma-54 dependent transcriptional regulator [Nitrospinota bacterium]|nr:sigma-54 dependent transcriptional regulator [Nitrospinota bacterium]